MNRVELESFLKSFLLFFLSLEILFSIIIFLQYKQNIQNLDNNLYNQLKICSFNLKCKNIDIKFIKKDKHLLYSLKKERNTVSSYFNISQSSKYMMKLTLKKTIYLSKINKLKYTLLFKYILISSVLFIFAILFSLYALHPMRQALILTEEFIKDILHDFNTPLSTLRLNTDMLKKEIDKNKKIDRIEQSVQNILNLQSNLRAYLEYQTDKAEYFSLKENITQRVEYIQKLYPTIKFIIDINDMQLFYNQDAFTRIVDNLLSNAAKYNKKNGFVKITFFNHTLQIQDSGIGIKNPQKVFKRFYKEHSRGIGIGLHIVKKLCDELKIKISITSKLYEGTTFQLTLR